jgi:hypothetical protein
VLPEIADPVVSGGRTVALIIKGIRPPNTDRCCCRQSLAPSFLSRPLVPPPDFFASSSYRN